MQVYIFKTNVAVITVCCCQTYTKKLKKNALQMFVKKQDLPKTELYQLQVVDRFAVSCCVKDFKLLRSFFFLLHLYMMFRITCMIVMIALWNA